MGFKERSYRKDGAYFIVNWKEQQPMWNNIKNFVKNDLAGLYRPQHRHWIVPASDKVEALLRGKGFMTEVEVEKEKEAFIQRRNADVVKEYPPLPVHPSLKDVELNESLLPKELRPYQIDAVKWAMAHMGWSKGGIVALQPGAGKSAITASFLSQYAWDKPILIVCPASLKTHWKRELKRWGNIEAQVIYSTFKMDSLRSHVEAVICNYEILHKIEDQLLDRISCIIVDEADYLQSESNLRVNAYNRIASLAEFQVFLTGTPLRNNAYNIYNLLAWSDKYWHDRKDFKKRYCEMGLGYGNKVVVKGSRNMQELHTRIQPWVYYKSLEEILPDLPKVNNTIYKLKPNKELLTASQEIDAILDANGWTYEDIVDSEIDSDNAELVKVLARIDELSRSSYAFKKGIFVNHIKDFMGETDESFIIVAYHQAVIDSLKLEFGFECIDGRVNPAHRQAIVDRFNDGERQGLILQAQAGAVGFSMPNCHYMFFAETTFSARDTEQMAGRIRRLTSTSDIAFYRFFAFEGTVDEKQLKAIAVKSKMASEVLTGTATNLLSPEFTTYEELD